jgi:hypothetical protein
VTDPFSADPGARLYRTGDLGPGFPTATSRSSAGSTIRSRSRGYRVELGEIEEAAPAPDVFHCAVALEGGGRAATLRLRRYPPGAVAVDEGCAVFSPRTCLPT